MVVATCFARPDDVPAYFDAVAAMLDDRADQDSSDSINCSVTVWRWEDKGVIGADGSTGNERGTVTIMIRFNLGDADPSIVPSVSRALCRAICLRLLLGRALAYEISRWCGLPALASYFPSTDWSLFYRPRRDERLSQPWG